MSIEAGFRRHDEIQNTDTYMMMEEGKSILEVIRGWNQNLSKK